MKQISNSKLSFETDKSSKYKGIQDENTNPISSVNQSLKSISPQKSSKTLSLRNVIVEDYTKEESSSVEKRDLTDLTQNKNKKINENLNLKIGYFDQQNQQFDQFEFTGQVQKIKQLINEKCHKFTISDSDIQFFVKDILSCGYSVNKVINSGGEGIVFEGISKEQKKIAIKLSQFDSSDKVKEQNSKQLQIKNVINCQKYVICPIEQFTIQESQMLVQFFELCENDLSFEIKNQKFDQQQIINIFFQLINSIIEIHAKQILHLDIKPQNILKTTSSYKLADFGSSRILQFPHINCQEFSQMTKIYSSPEQQKSRKNISDNQFIPITYASDIFSLGLTFLLILGVNIKKKIVNNNNNQVKIAQAIREGYWPEKEIQEQVKQENQTLLSFVRYYMLNSDPYKRKRALILKKILIRYYNGQNMKLQEENDRINLLIDQVKLKNEEQRAYLAYLYCFLGQIGENPEDNFQKAVDISQEIQEFSRQDFYYFLEELGIAQLNKFKFQPAENNLKKCHQLRIEEHNKLLSSSSHLDVAESYMSLSLLYEKLGNLNKVLEFELNGLKIRRDVFNYHDENQSDENRPDQNHPDIAQSLNRVGAAYVLIDELDKGLKYQQDSIEMREKLFSGSHPDKAESYESIAQTYSKKGDDLMSIKFSDKSMEIWHKIEEGDSQQKAELLYNQGLIQGRLGKHEESLIFFEKSLQMRKALFKEQHPKTAQSYHGMAIAYENQRNFDKSLEYYQKSYEIRQNTLPENHPDISLSLSHLSIIYMKKQDFKKALTLSEMGLNMRKLIFPENHYFIAISLNNVGTSYAFLNQHDKALEYQFQSYHLGLKVFKNRDHSDMVQALRSIAVSYFQNKMYKESIEYNMKALEMRQRLADESHPQIIYTLRQIVESYKLLGDKENTEIYEEKVRILHDKYFKSKN